MIKTIMPWLPCQNLDWRVNDVKFCDCWTTSTMIEIVNIYPKIMIYHS